VSHSEFISLVPDRSPHQVVGERVVILPGISLEILTTRRIELEKWVLEELNDPYWRLYVPTAGEAVVWTGSGSQRVETRLVPGEAYIISPRTTFSSNNPEAFGKWYAHFTLGPSADRANPGIYPIEYTDPMRSALKILAESDGEQRHPWSSASLVVEALRQLPEEIWKHSRIDPRLERAMEFMHANLNRKLSCADVAEFAGLSVRSLNHLFQQQIATTPMRVLLDLRLDKACRLLRHNNDSIEQIASETGFPNRYYFSRMLKQHRGTSPAAYRQGQF
jgi:AraC-like DNA-binding protein